MLNTLAFIVKLDALLETLVTTIVFVVIGLIAFAIAYFIFDKITPFSVRKGNRRRPKYRARHRHRLDYDCNCDNHRCGDSRLRSLQRITG